MARRATIPGLLSSLRSRPRGVASDQIFVSGGTGTGGTGGPPSGAAGGVLSGTYPDPGFAADMATQAELNAHESDTTSVHGIADTSTLYRSGGTDVAVADGGTGASTAADARTNLGVGTTDSPQFAGVNIGAATDTTITRTGAGDVAVEGNAIYRAGGTDVPVADGGTGSSTAAGARTNLDVPSNAEAVLDSLVDAKGDLIVGTAADTVARRAVGSDGQVLTADAAETSGVKWATPATAGDANPGVCEGRLTLTTAVPVTSSDVIGATTIYFTPYGGNQVALYDGAAWSIETFSERSLALGTLTSGKNYDVFLYDNSGTLTLELTAWTSDSARATSLTTQDGVYVKSGATTRRYLGTIRTTSTTTTEDSAAKRFVWNHYNRKRRVIRRIDTTSSWTYNSATWRQARATAANQVEAIQGLAEDAIDLSLGVFGNMGGGNWMAVGIGVDSTTAPHSESQGATTYTAVATGALTIVPAAGYHYFTWLERCSGAATGTFYGEITDGSGVQTRARLGGTVFA